MALFNFFTGSPVNGPEEVPEGLAVPQEYLFMKKRGWLPYSEAYRPPSPCDDVGAATMVCLARDEGPISLTPGINVNDHISPSADPDFFVNMYGCKDPRLVTKPMSFQEYQEEIVDFTTLDSVPPSVSKIPQIQGSQAVSSSSTVIYRPGGRFNDETKHNVEVKSGHCGIIELSDSSDE